MPISNPSDSPDVLGSAMAERKTLPTLHAEGFSASVDAFACDHDPDPAARRMRLWFISLLGPQQAVKALWARLIKGETATMSFEDLGQARFCALSPEGPRAWRFFTASLPAAAGYQGVLGPEAALYASERPDFLLLARRGEEVPMLHYRFLNRRLDLPLHPDWADWLWARALRSGEAVVLESCGLHAYRCVPDADTLAVDLTAAVRRGELRLVECTTRPTARSQKRMSRLESTARAGYYPTPPRVVGAIANHLRRDVSNSKRVVRLLDPCAGTGDAAAAISQAVGAETYGIEINEERARAARTRLDHVLTTSAFSVRLANGAFSCLWMNAPYDYDEEKRRLEHAFLTSMTRALCPAGVLVFLIPQRRLAVSARYLASHYAGFLTYRFPDPEYAAFRQIALFATRKAQPTLDPSAQARLEAWSSGELAPLPDAPAGPPFTLPALPAGEILFASLFFDPLQAAAEAWRRGVWVQPQVVEQLWPPDERPVRPLMPLRKGHLALLIAAGMLNNVILSEGGQRVLVKGRTHKELVPVDSADEQIEIEREVLRTSVMVLDLTTGTLEVIEQGGVSTPMVSQEQAA